MFTGIDFSFSRVPPAVAAAAGHRFAISYLTDLDTDHRKKAWNAVEIAAYRAAGLGVVAVWQGGGADRTAAWRGGYERGVRDARLAAQQSGALGRPTGQAGRPVYFAVDFDVQPSDLTAVGRYFDGIASVFDPKNIGIYGGARVIQWAMSSGKAAWFWQTGAWSGGHKVPGIHLYQRVPETRLGPYAVDIDEAHQADYGQWFDVPGGGTGMRLVSRAEWGARPYRLPSGATTYSGPRAGVKVHYLGTAYSDRSHDQCAAYVRSLQASHMDGNGWSDIGYSFLICTHGYVFEGRGLRRRNSANGSTSLNERHYAVCALLGNSGMTRPTDAQLHGIRDAIEYCRSQGPAGSEIRGHRDGYATDCPGGPLYAWVQAGAPRPGGGAPAPAPSTPSAPARRVAEVSGIEKELKPGFDPVQTQFTVFSQPDSISVGCDLGDIRVAIFVFTNSANKWYQLVDAEVYGDKNLAFWALPFDTRKIAVKRWPRHDGDTKDDVPATVSLKYKPVVV